MSVVVQPRQQRSTKGIAGADRIYKMDRYGFHADPQVSMRPERTGDALIVTGLVRNTGRAPAKGLTAVVFAFDRGGNFLASGRAPVDFVTLGPGDDSPFRVTVPQVGDIGRYRVSFRSGDRIVPHVDTREPVKQ